MILHDPTTRDLAETVILAVCLNLELLDTFSNGLKQHPNFAVDVRGGYTVKSAQYHPCLGTRCLPATEY